MGEPHRRRPSSRRQHTVPRFHLKRFADANERIMRVPICIEHAPHPCGIKDVAVRNDFYSLPDGTGQLDDSIEIALFKLEREAAHALRIQLESEGLRVPLPGDGGCGGRTIRIEDLERLMEKLVFAKLEEVEPLDEGDPDDPRRLSKKRWKSGSAA